MKIVFVLTTTLFLQFHFRVSFSKPGKNTITDKRFLGRVARFFLV
jgi:hypothetical protein